MNANEARELVNKTSVVDVQLDLFEIYETIEAAASSGKTQIIREVNVTDINNIMDILRTEGYAVARQAGSRDDKVVIYIDW